MDPSKGFNKSKMNINYTHEIQNKKEDKKEDKKPRKREHSPDPEVTPKTRKMIDDEIFKFFFNGEDGFEQEPERELRESRKKNDCPNPKCNHKDYHIDGTKITTPEIPINDINDLITIGKTYHCKKNLKYHGISLRLLCNLVEPLTELNNMVGMQTVKESIVNQIIFFLQGFNKKDACGKCNECAFGVKCVKGNEDMLHTIITGSPGCGKTEIGKILGKIYKAMGILENGKLRVVSRSDLIGKYLGATAIKTQEVINSCKGGVMFIDEAYALGNAEGRDSFSKECLDTLNQNLSEKRDFLCIIAGYKNELEKCFFSMNPGLRRRFTFRYDIAKYTSDELLDIFKLKLKNDGWSLENENKELHDLFKSKSGYMPNYGGDIETLFLNCKIVHGRRVLLLEKTIKKILTVADIKEGFDKFINNRKNKNAIDLEYTDTNLY